jgi:toxin CptA
MTSSAKFAVPFRIPLKTSFILNGALLVMYLGAYRWLWLFDLDFLIKLVAFIAVSVGLVVHLRQYLFRNSRRAVMNMIWEERDQWQLETTTGEIISAKLQGSSYVNPWLIVLNFRPEEGGGMVSVVVMPDSVDSTTFRRLSVKLRVYGGDAVEQQGV